MRLLVANPNRVAGCTALIEEQAVLAGSGFDRITAVEPRWGPVELASDLDTEISAAGVLDRVRAEEEPFDALVLAGFAEPGAEAARTMLSCPVVDITEAGPSAAMFLGRRFAVLTSTEEAVLGVEDRLRALALDGRCAGVAAAGAGVPDLLADRGRALDTLGASAARLPRCDVVVLGCAGMAGLADPLAQLVGRPVVDPLRAAVHLAAALVGLGAAIPPGTPLSHTWPF